MKKCQRCGNENLDYANFCDNCGSPLSESAALPEKSPPDSFVTAQAVYPERARRAVLRALATGVEYQLEVGREFRIGRGDPARGLRPEISLPEPLALQQGVSRLHAKILYEEGIFYLVDLNSTNSTYINGSKLQPQQAYSLRDGDIIELGNYKLQYVIM